MPTVPVAAAAGPRPPTRGYRALLADREFRALHLSFTATAVAGTLSALALGTLVGRRTGSPLLVALSLYGGTLATVVGALTLMSVADGRRPRRTLLLLQLVTAVAVGAQAVPGLPLAARFALLLAVGFVQCLGTGARLGLLTEVVPASAYAPARSLLNLTAGALAVVGLAVGAVLLRRTSPEVLLGSAAALVALAALPLVTSVREHSTRGGRRPGLRGTWAADVALVRRPDQRAVLVALWVPNGLVVGCEALLIPLDPRSAGFLLAAGSAGLLLGDLAVGRFLTAAARARAALPLRVVLAAPYLLFALRPPLGVAAVAVFVAGTGFAATLPLQERLLALVPESERGQVQGVESAGRLAWQGVGAVAGGALAERTGPAVAITLLAVASLAVTACTAAAGAPGTRRGSTKSMITGEGGEQGR